MVISLSSISLCHFYFHRTCYLLTDVHCRGKPGYHKSIHMEILPFEPFLYSILPCCWWLIFSSRLNFIFVTGRRGRDRILCSLESEEFFWVVFVALFNTRTRAGGWHEWLTGQDLSIWQGLSRRGDRRTHRCLMGIDRPDTILPAPKRPWKIFKAYLLILDRIEFQPQSPSSLSFQDTELHLSSDLVDCPTRWSLWYWYLDFYVDHLYISITRWLEKYSTAMC